MGPISNFKPFQMVLRFNSAYVPLKEFAQKSITEHSTNMPVKMVNPFIREKRKCVLCRHRITPNYKNVRLLSQFVSRFTGKVYSRNITGLCQKQQVAMQFAINRAIVSGLMASYYRDPEFAHDPKLFDPDNPFRPHRY